MLAASVYIAVCSARNRIRVRLRRLREPRYLVGAIVGAAYLYFSIFLRSRSLRPSGRRGRNAPAPFELTAAARVTGSALGGLAVFVFAFVAWILPMNSGVFAYSEAERAILFPAPVSRRQLIVHRLIRSQAGSLLASVIIAVFAPPASGNGRLRVALAMWVLLVTWRVYSAGIALTRARFKSTEVSIKRGARPTIAVVAAAFLIVGGGIGSSLQSWPASASDAIVHLSRAVENGLPHVVLWPFIAVLRPLFVASWSAFAGSFAASLLVLAMTVVWMLSNDAAFDLAVGEQSIVAVEPIDAAAVVSPVERSGWTLATTGRVEVALFWKGAMQTLRTTHFKWRYLPPLAALLFAFGVSSATFMRAGEMRGPASLLTMLGGFVSVMAMLLGPQIMRGDLRSDFEHLDVLKTWPTSASQVIRGELVWPVAAVSAVVWAAALTAGIFSGAALPRVAFVDRWSVVVAALIAAPSMIAAQYAVQNTATILFPGWVQIGTQRARGIDAIGQRLILLAAIVVSLLLFALPGAVGAAVLWIVFRRLVGVFVFVPMAIVFSAIVLTEVLVVTELLGPAYERLDVMSIEKPE